jgi:diguanylate cyclase (GGDEF)-like protein
MIATGQGQGGRPPLRGTGSTAITAPQNEDMSTPMKNSTEALFTRVIGMKDIAVHFQPIIHLQSQQIYGYEGLARGPVNTVLHSADCLFNAANQFGQLAELDLICRERVIERFAQLGLPGRLFINVDPHSLANENYREGQTLAVLDRVGLSPERVIIELTETHPVEDVHLMRMGLEHFRRMGFRVALDDLGAGYSGLKLWSEIRPDIVKIDRHFIRNIGEDRTKQQFVSAIHKIATSLGCRVITEGVETIEEYATLRKLGVEMVQGYYFCRPTEVPPTTLSPRLFRSEERTDLEAGVPTVETLCRTAVTVEASTRFLRVGDLFTTMPEMESIVVTSHGEILGLVLRKSFMNLYASLYGKELHGKQQILGFVNRNVLQIDKQTTLEEASFRLTTSLDIHTDEFIVVDSGSVAGKGRLIDLLREITKLQVTRARYANPLTLLPGNVPIQQQLQRLFAAHADFVVCYFDLDHFKPFNDFFGFSRGDMVLKFVAELLTTTLTGPDDFVGHVGGDDFVAILHDADWEAAIRSILHQFDDCIGGFYNGHIGCVITATDREGTLRDYDKMTLSVGAVVVSGEAEESAAAHLSTAAATAKHHAKAMPGSSLYSLDAATHPVFAPAP